MRTNSAVIQPQLKVPFGSIPPRRVGQSTEFFDLSSFPESTSRVMENPLGTQGNLDSVEISNFAGDKFLTAKDRRGVDLDWDPFVSSSPRAASLKGKETARKGTIQTLTALKSAEEIDDDSLTSTPPKTKRIRGRNWDPISSSAPDLIHQSDPFASSPRANPPRGDSNIINLESSDDESHDTFPDIGDLDVSKLRASSITSKPLSRTASKAHSKPSKATSSEPASSRTICKKTAAERQREREEKAASRDAEKQRKMKEKDAAREQRAKDKEKAAALVEVNKVRTDKKTSTPEMVVDLPESLNPALSLQIQTLLNDLGVQCGIWKSPVGSVVKWTRKVTSKFNDELGLWEPTPLVLQPEKHALVIVSAEDFVTFALSDDDGSSINLHVQQMKQHFPGCELIYLIDGLGPWMRKNRNIRNRQFASAVRGQAEPQGTDSAQNNSSQPTRKRKNATIQTYLSEDKVEDALLQLQVMHNVLIHHTNAQVETAQWVTVFTQHISTVPYKRQREEGNLASFCMDAGQVRTGDDTRDTYVRMLQEIARVTAPIAYGILAEFGTVTELVKGLEARGSLVLEDCRKSTNKDGSFSDRTVGKSISRRVYKVFTGTDETSTDI
jgi:crossover junction endonuclease EME1